MQHRKRRGLGSLDRIASPQTKQLLKQLRSYHIWSPPSTFTFCTARPRRIGGRP